MKKVIFIIMAICLLKNEYIITSAGGGSKEVLSSTISHHKQNKPLLKEENQTSLNELISKKNYPSLREYFGLNKDPWTTEATPQQDIQKLQNAFKLIYHPDKNRDKQAAANNATALISIAFELFRISPLSCAILQIGDKNFDEANFLKIINLHWSDFPLLSNTDIEMAQYSRAKLAFMSTELFDDANKTFFDRLISATKKHDRLDLLWKVIQILIKNGKTNFLKDQIKKIYTKGKSNQSDTTLKFILCFMKELDHDNQVSVIKNLQEHDNVLLLHYLASLPCARKFSEFRIKGSILKCSSDKDILNIQELFNTHSNFASNPDNQNKTALEVFDKTMLKFRSDKRKISDEVLAERMKELAETAGKRKQSIRNKIITTLIIATKRISEFVKSFF